jgi:hypothetical protein
VPGEAIVAVGQDESFSTSWFVSTLCAVSVPAAITQTPEAPLDSSTVPYR